MSTVSLCIVCDGTSDFCIKNIIEWIIDSSFPNSSFRTIEARELVPAHGALSDRLARAHDLYKPSIIICHRDAEAAAANLRITEIKEAVENARIPGPVVPTVPIRMIESWLLADEAAIRSAADNRNGQDYLNLPNPKQIEGLTDPKAVLFNALRVASGLPPQRLRRFNEGRARARITSFISDFSVLRHQVGFQHFENELVTAFDKVSRQLVA